ncbi:restriction endonuclease subunit S [Endozoicomonas euniceicola]|uniref:Restriction endonuclease subunit S n=1 Tax=Endozoicomonas euniceicola TaxID=1234143 RepID=A0ABY6GPD7_9GAMM|nr:restriction endonuclease subunit S [Endozoicomonas euniceicola]UYM14592.1 restriction endonuclease subunit S [Endozoicomonas euniceicola]
MEFKRYSFKELLSNIVDNRGKTCPTQEEGIPLIATNCIKNDALYAVYEKVRFVSQETYDTWFRGHPEPGDIIFVCKGSPGRIAWVQDPVPYCIAQDMVAIRADEKKIDPKFLFALLRSPKTQASILNMHVGTMIPHFKKGDFANLYFDIPIDMDHQKFAGELYYKLCQKIEHNRQTNQTLENMAQALFKSWFVDFDPVIDNALAAGNAIPEPLQKRAEQRQALQASDDAPAPLSEAIRQLFPASFVFDAEMGWIPEGWEIGCLEDMLVLQRGFDLPKSKRTPGQFPLIVASGQDGTHSEHKVEGPGVVTGRSGKLGEVMFVHDNFWPLNTTLWIKEYKNSNPYHAYHLLKTLGLDQYNSGSAVPTLNRNHIHNMRLLVPAKPVVSEYQKLVAGHFKKIRHNNHASETLAKLRDTLLPKLISGQLRIPEAQQQTEAAVA